MRCERVGHEAEERDQLEDCAKNNSIGDQIPTNNTPRPQLSPLVHPAVTGHKRACVRDRTGPGNR